jgi:glutamate formiminotransferase
LREAAVKDAARRPDVGGPELHATAGASAVGARSFLIAYNIYLSAASSEPGSGEPAPDVSVARSIARDIRASNGGMQGVKAIGVMANGRSQVSMNITDYRVTPMHDVHATVGQLARRYGVQVSDGELIGLIPEAAYEPDADWLRQIPGFDAQEKVLERRLESPMAWP